MVSSKNESLTDALNEESNSNENYEAINQGEGNLIAVEDEPFENAENNDYVTAVEVQSSFDLSSKIDRVFV